jgi:hypothetical protein
MITIALVTIHFGGLVLLIWRDPSGIRAHQRRLLADSRKV